MPAGYSFRPRAWTLALAAAGCAAFIALGQWQAGRADEKRAAAAAVERILVHGEFVAQHTVLLDNKLRRGKPGYEVVTPLRLADGIHVLVNRGWIAAGPRRDDLPRIDTPAGRVRVEGIVRERLPRPLQVGEPGRSRVRQGVELADFAAETGLVLQKFVIEQHSAMDDRLLREWVAPGTGVEKHASYSLQWYSLAALAAALGLIFSFRRVAAT
jgi:surfeit locus 1 family protein